MREVAVHAVLAVGGLVVAYLVWTDDGESAREEEVTVVDCDAARLSQVSFQGPDRLVTLERRTVEGAPPMWWITSSRNQDEGDPVTEQFVGSDAVDEYLERIAPLRAKRELGSVADDMLEELELGGEDSTRLALTCAGREHAFEVGGSAYGSGDRYLRASGGEVFLVEQRIVRDVESPTTLMQRDLHRFEGTEVEHLEVQAHDRQVRLLQRNRLDPRSAEWVDASQPDRRNELYGNWLERVERLRVQSYLAPDATPGSDLEGVSAAPTTLATLVYRDEDGDELGRTELVKVEGGDEPAYYARSEATRSWVRLLASLGQQVETDLRPVVGLEPLEPPAPPPAQTPPEGGEPEERPDGDEPAPEDDPPAPEPEDDGHGHGNLPPGHP